MENKLKGIPGIYKIYTITNSRIYIGSAADLYARYHRHKHDFSKNKHCNSRLQNYVNKYGFHSLLFEVIELCQKQDLTIREQHWIDTLKPYYNICQIAGNTLGLNKYKVSQRVISRVINGVGIYDAACKRFKEQTMQQKLFI